MIVRCSAPCHDEIKCVKTQILATLSSEVNIFIVQHFFKNNKLQGKYAYIYDINNNNKKTFIV